jgi:hypothetical protein
MITSYQQLSWTEKNDMKNFILKWLGLENALTFSHSDFIDDCITSYISRKYDLAGMESKLEDLESTLENGKYEWDDLVDKLSYFDPSDYATIDELRSFEQEYKDAIDKVQAVDDRLTEMVAGYKLDVQLIKEDF